MDFRRNSASLRSEIQVNLRGEAVYHWLLNHVAKITDPIILTFPRVRRIGVGEM